MDVTEIPMERLEAELVSFAAWEAAGLAKVLPVLAEFDRRQGWASWGCRSAQHWLSWKCGLGYTAATERLRVARALQQLPCTAAMFARATLSWSKVREITRVATPDDEAKWAELAEWMTAAQLVRLTAAARKVTGRDLARQLERRALSISRDDDGSVTISVRLPADQAHLVLGAVRHATTPAKGQAWSASAADALVDHHTGGKTAITKLVRLCWFHHRFVHLHHLILTLPRNRTLTVTTRDGTPIDRPIPHLRFDIDPPTHPDHIGHWQGDPMHLNDCLQAIGIT